MTNDCCCSLGPSVWKFHSSYCSCPKPRRNWPWWCILQCSLWERVCSAVLSRVPCWWTRCACCWWLKLPLIVIIVVLPGQFEPYLKSYIEKFKYKTVTTDQWKEHFLKYFHEKVGRLVACLDESLRLCLLNRLSRGCLMQWTGMDGSTNLDFHLASQSMKVALTYLVSLSSLCVFM